LRGSLVWKTVLSSASTNGFETDLGARVRTLRRERGLTLKGLGRLAGLSHPFLSQVERGLARPSVGSVERIAAAMGVSVAHLWAPAPQAAAVTIQRRDEGAVDEATGLRALGGGHGTPVLREWTARTRRWPA
jgi:transcriptional regulator with XRE-family HTH domain